MGPFGCSFGTKLRLGVEWVRDQSIRDEVGRTDRSEAPPQRQKKAVFTDPWLSGERDTGLEGAILIVGVLSYRKPGRPFSRTDPSPFNSLDLSRPSFPFLCLRTETLIFYFSFSTVGSSLDPSLDPLESLLRSTKVWGEAGVLRWRTFGSPVRL